MPTRRSLSIFSVVLAAGLCGVALLGPGVHAQRGGGVRAQIYLTQARIPDGLSERGLIGFARGHRAARLSETSEQNLNERAFLANVVFSFNRPPGDLEFHALFYDVHDGPRQFLREMSIFTADRTQKTVLHRLRLPRPTFRPNRRYEMVVTVSRQEVGTQRFETLGEEIRHTGQVDFTEDQARGRD